MYSHYTHFILTSWSHRTLIQTKLNLSHLTGNQGNEWKMGSFKTDLEVTPYRVMFRAVAGRSFKGDIALDDFKIEKCNKSQQQGKSGDTSWK